VKIQKGSKKRIQNKLCCHTRYYVVNSGLAIGQTIVDANNFLRKYPNSYVLTSVDSDKFMKTFIARITDDQAETEKYWNALRGAL